MRNGERVPFNRQPSLHKQSIMGHRVRIFSNKYKTFRMNLQVCSPYNADFDGDEMNLHGVQSQEGRTECAELMAVSKQLVTPKNSRPCVEMSQDTCVGAYLLTNLRCSPAAFHNRFRNCIRLRPHRRFHRRRSADRRSQSHR